jgi:hypothetical protein
MSRTYRRLRFRTGALCPATGKVSFPSTTAARSFIDVLKEWDGVYMRAYRCPRCEWVHLTSQRTYREQRMVGESA